MGEKFLCPSCRGELNSPLEYHQTLDFTPSSLPAETQGGCHENRPRGRTVRTATCPHCRREISYPIKATTK